MKNVLIICLIVCYSQLIAQNKKKDGPYTSYHANGSIETSGFYKNGKRVGDWKEYFLNGQLSNKKIYDDKGKYTGSSQAYFKNGNKKFVTLKNPNTVGYLLKSYYEDTGGIYREMTSDKKLFNENSIIKSGFYKEYFKNSSLKQQGKYVDGELDGLWSSFYDTGEKEWEINYKHSMQQGVYKKYYKNGKLNLEGQNDFNRKKGEEKRYNDKGVLEWKGKYVDDKLNGLWKTFDSSGTVINSIKFKNGKTKGAIKTLEATNIPDGNYFKHPIYPGCEKIFGYKQQKKCMSSAIAKFVNLKFDERIGKNNGLTGKKKIYIIFKIDEEGEATRIRSRASHPSLEKEAIRIIKKLPKMIPGSIRGKRVKVAYSLPVIFSVLN